MKRLTMGAALGGFAVYLFDPELGEDRRKRMLSFWRENRGGAAQAGRVASDAAESARPLARRITKAVGRNDWAQALDRRRPAVGLPMVIGALVLGGTLIFFLDPVHGSERRQRLLSSLEAGRQAARQTVKLQADRVSDRVADAGEGVMPIVR